MTEWVALSVKGKVGCGCTVFFRIALCEVHLVKPNFVNFYYASSHDDGEALGTWDFSISAEYT